VTARLGLLRRIAIGLTIVVCLVAANSLRPGRVAVADRTPGSRHGALAVAWNQMAYDLAFAEDQFLTFKRASAPSR
jgi:hypothetical protein